MTIGERIFGPGLGRRVRMTIDFEPTTNVVSISGVAGTLFLSAGILGIVSPLITAFGANRIEGFRPGHVVAIGLIALILSPLTFAYGDLLPWPGVIAVLLGGVGLVALATYFSGPHFGPYASTLFVWPAMAAALFAHRRAATVVVVIIAVLEAIVVAIQPVSLSPVSRWLLVVGTCVATMFVVDTAMTLLMRALAAEEVAKANLREVSKHKSDFLASMSHELRTPLNAIIGFSDVLAGQHFGPLNERQLGHVADVQEAGRHLLELINDVLDMSKIEAGSIDLERRVFSLADTIGAAVNFIAPRAAENHIAVTVDVTPEATEAFGDERRIKQVLANLLSNAVKFTSPGGCIAVTADADQFATTVTVTDDGVGIAPDDLDRIFDEFQQAGDVHTAIEGTGLGLALSRRLLELHGGSITATSEVGRGSTFAFSIPRQSASATA